MRRFSVRWMLLVITVVAALLALCRYQLAIGVATGAVAIPLFCSLSAQFMFELSGEAAALLAWLLGIPTCIALVAMANFGAGTETSLWMAALLGSGTGIVAMFAHMLLVSVLYRQRKR